MQHKLRQETKGKIEDQTGQLAAKKHHICPITNQDSRTLVMVDRTKMKLLRVILELVTSNLMT